jgi:putative ABC transport system permease protein
LWIPYAAVDYFYFHHRLAVQAYYPLYLLLATVFIRVAAVAFSRPIAEMPVNAPPVLTPTLPAELKQKGIWLKNAVKENRYYEDPELSLGLLAEKLGLHTHELSRIINTALKKSFNDFINEYRVVEAARKMQDLSYDRLTLLGIAYESGFNSQRTFNRVFKEMTGKTPVEYKNRLKKELPIDKLATLSRISPIILRHETISKWSHEKLNRNFMFRNYLKIAYRSLIKNKGFTAINILGLSVGLATSLLIVFYVVDELSYDRYNVNAGNIYRITEQIKFNGNEGSYAVSEGPLMGSIKDLPGIEKYARMLPTESLFISPRKYFIKKGNEDIQENKLIFAESNIFDVFTLPMIHGNPRDALSEPHSIVITESAAKKYFNKTAVIGQTLTLNDTGFYKVTGVLKDIPVQSHFNYDFFVSFSSLPESKLTNWGFSGFHTYLMLKPGANVKALQAAITGIAIKEGYPPKLWSTGDNYLREALTPLLDIHLRSTSQYELSKGGSIQYVYIFSVIAIFILLIACVNFMNLSTARSSKRAKEVGVRKVLGSARKYLIAQFLTESILVTLVATITALLFAALALPLFNHVADKHLSFTLQSLSWLLPSLVIVVLVIGFLAGSYPAFYLSAFQPIEVLKGKIAAGFKGGFLRGFLVVFQFSISIFLIIGTLVIYNQLNYIHSKSLGFNRSQVLVIKNVTNLGANAKLLKQELKQFPGVVSTTMSGYLPTGEDRSITALFPNQPIDLKDDVITQFWPVDEDYISTMGIQLVAGRNFSSEMATDSSAIIVNEAYAKRLDVKNPLGKIVYRDTYGIQPYHIIGVMKDFNFSSLHDKIGNAVLYDAENRGAISVKVKTANLPALLSQLESKWKSMAPNQPFTYSFMDEDFDATYRSEQRIGTLFIAFSILAILIACLGLFGLAAYAAEQRNKEIGVRKVLGASVSGIVSLLSMDFIKLVFIAIVIASPVGWFAMNKWLQGFAYRVDVAWWIVAVAGLTAIFIAFVTISFQSIRAAIANPVDSLRSE